MSEDQVHTWKMIGRALAYGLWVGLGAIVGGLAGGPAGGVLGGIAGAIAANCGDRATRPTGSTREPIEGPR